MRRAFQHVLVELLYHAPFTALGTLVGVILAVVLTFNLSLEGIRRLSDLFFHVAHPLHLFLSALVTSAVYYRHVRRLEASLLIGVVGAVGICAASDAFIPYVGGTLLGVSLKLHICLLIHPHVVIAPSIVGSLVGVLLAKNHPHPSLLPHGGHVLISVAASLLYFMAYGFSILSHLASIFLVVFIAVLIPCCTSDIVLPSALTPMEASHEACLTIHPLKLKRGHKAKPKT